MAKCNPMTVISVAESQIGYLEKRSNAQLDSFTGNAGQNNYTKYNRDYLKWHEGGALSMQWCAAFTSWCFVQAYGLGAARELLCGGVHCYTPTGAGRFKRSGRYIQRGQGLPRPGDAIYFYSQTKKRIGHVGIVYKVSSSRVYTIEGNTGGANRLITNGGGVCRKSYRLNSGYIDGYGRPNYAAVDTMEGERPAIELGDRLLVNGCEGDDVKELQQNLIDLGYSCGRWGADGEYGDGTELAVIEFQRDAGVDADGEYGHITHRAMCAAIEAASKPVENARVRISGGNCWIRTAPNTGAEKLGLARRDDVFEYQGETSDDGWHLIIFDDKNAWVSGKYGKLVEK